MGNIHSELGHYQEAEKLLQEAMLFFDNHCSECQNDYKAWALVCNGVNYTRMGQFKKAETLLLRSLELHKKFYGPEHILTLLVLTALEKNKHSPS